MKIYRRSKKFNHYCDSPMHIQLRKQINRISRVGINTKRYGESWVYDIVNRQNADEN